MDWDQDKGIFYFIDTADSVVRSYPVDENGVPKRSADGVLVGVREVSSRVHDSMPQHQNIWLCIAAYMPFSLQVLCLYSVKRCSLGIPVCISGWKQQVSVDLG